MSIVLSTYVSFNDTTSGDDVNTHILRSQWGADAHHLAFGNLGVHYDQIWVTNISSDPLRITFDDFNNTKIDAGEGFVIRQGTYGPIKVHAQYLINVKRHSGSGNVEYSVMATMDNKF